MHELRIAESIVETVQGEIKRRNLQNLKAVGVRIGALSGVNPDALEFGFQAITVDTPLAGVTLKIEEIAVKGTCRACGKEFQVAEFIFVCPHCFSGNIAVTEGEELDIAYLETN